jgi:hypothetical protein
MTGNGYCLSEVAVFLSWSAREFGTGVLSTSTIVPPRATVIVSITLYGSLIDFGKEILDSASNRRVMYKIRGRLLLFRPVLPQRESRRRRVTKKGNFIPIISR